MKKYWSVLGCWLVLCLSLQAQVIDFYDPVEVLKVNTTLSRVNASLDIDDDGIKDIVVATIFPDSIYFYKGLSNGTFIQYARINGTYEDIRILDMDNDGKKDIVFVDNGELYLAINNGTGGFNVPLSYHIGGDSDEISVADLNNDGYSDVVAPTTHDLDPTYFFNSVFINNGNSTLKERVQYIYPTVYPNHPITGYYVSLLDMNNDGYKDIVNPFTGKDSLLIYLNKGDGTFDIPSRVVFPKQATHTEVLDLDHDGKEDLACFTYDPIQGQEKVLYSKAFYLQKATSDDNRLETTVVDSILGISDFKLTDINNDGEYDIIFHEGYLIGGAPDYPQTDSVVIFLNKGNLTFDFNKKSYSKRYPTYYLTVEDYNGDGLKDFLIVLDPDNNPVINIMYQKAVINRIEKSIGSSQLSIYPNPSAGEVTISSITQAMQGVIVYDAMGGKVIEHHDLQVQNLSLNFNKFPKGLYHLQIELIDGSITQQHLILE